MCNFAVPDLFTWLSRELGIDFKSVKALLFAEAYCTLVAKAWPGSISRGRVKKDTGRGFDSEANY